MTKEIKQYSGLMTTLEKLNVNTSEDRFSLDIVDGSAKFILRRANGEVLTKTMMFNTNYSEQTQFNGNIDIARRQELVKKMYKTNLTQREIADRLGVSQSTVSNDLRE